MKASVLATLVIGVASPGLATPEPAAALLPASVCISYETTYYTTVKSPAATETHSGLGGNDSGHPPHSGVTRPPPRLTSATGTTQPSPSPVITEAVIFSIVPEGANGKKKKRDLAKRASGGFLNTAEDGIKNSCDEASVFGLAAGELLSEGIPIWADPAAERLLFTNLGRPGGSARPGLAVTRTFEVDARGYLQWKNETFPQGEAYFCQVVSDAVDGEVFIVFTSEQSEWPAGCQAVGLKTFGAAQCQNGELEGTTTTSTARPTGPRTRTSIQSHHFQNSTMTAYPHHSTSHGSRPDVTSSHDHRPTVGPSHASEYSHSLPTSSATSSSICAFSTSGSVAADGGFEDGTNPFTLSPGSVEVGSFKYAVKPSSGAPVPDDSLCSYFFEVDYIPTTEADTIEFLYRIPTERGLRYVASFIALINSRGELPSRSLEERLPNPFQADWEVTINGVTIGQGSYGYGTEWDTYYGDFYGTGDDVIAIIITAKGRGAIFAFDNFFVFPSGNTLPTLTSAQSSSMADHTSSSKQPHVTSTPSYPSQSSVRPTTSGVPPAPTHTTSVTAGEDVHIDISSYHLSRLDQLSITKLEPRLRGAAVDSQFFNVTIPRGFSPGTVIQVALKAVRPGGSDIIYLELLVVSLTDFSSRSTRPFHGSATVTQSTSQYSQSSGTAPSFTTTICPFATSGSIIPDGGFENNIEFFTSTKSGVGTLTAAPYPAASVPVVNPLACQYVLMVHVQTSRGSTELELTYDFDAAEDEIYSISFQNLVCGSGGSSATWTVQINDAIIETGSIVGNCNAWTTYSKNFVASGEDELIVYFDVPSTAGSDVYFDNFVIVPLNGGPSPSHSTSSAIDSAVAYTTQAPSSSSSNLAQTTSSATSAAFCPFSTSGSLLTTGAFENVGGDSPLTHATGQYTQRILSSAEAPAGPNHCQGVLEIETDSDVGDNNGLFYWTPSSPLTKGQTYSASIDVLACGPATDIWQFGFEGFLLANGTGGDCSALPDGDAKRDVYTPTQWRTYTGYYTGGSNIDGVDVLFIQLISDAPIVLYFDNIIVVPVPGVAAPSSVSTSQASVAASSPSYHSRGVSSTGTGSYVLPTFTSASESESESASSTTTTTSATEATSKAASSTASTSAPGLTSTSTPSPASSIESTSTSTSTSARGSPSSTASPTTPSSTMSSATSSVTSSSLASTSSVSYTLMTSYVLTSSTTVINYPSSSSSSSSSSYASSITTAPAPVNT